jgi:RNA polymerase sigma-70 factor (ECF subfamily)
MVKDFANQSEGTLIRLSIEGEVRAFEVLYLRHMDAIYRYFFLRIGDQDQSEDMTEDVFLRAWEALPNFKIGRRPLLHWLYRIAHNLLVDHYRKRKPISLPIETISRVADPSEAPEGAHHRKQEVEMIVNAVQQLGEIEQQVILLRFVEGLSHQEIGVIINKSTAASRVIQHRALKTLKSHLIDLRTENG